MVVLLLLLLMFFKLTNQPPKLSLLKFSSKFLTDKNFMGGVQKGPTTTFSHITSTNIRISSENFLTFSFSHFSTLVLNFNPIPSASPKLLNLNQKHLSKKFLFCQIVIKLEAMKASFSEMLELQNCGHMSTFTL